MTFKNWQNVNLGYPIMLLWTAIGIVVHFWEDVFPKGYFTTPLSKVSLSPPNRQKIKRVLLGLMFVTLFYTIVFEAYFQRHYCTVSSVYYDRNIELATDVTQRLLENEIPFWLDYATLLGYLREDPINVWDHDTDFSVLFSEAHPRTGEKIDTVKLLLRLFNDDRMHSFYEEERKLLQVRYRGGNQGAHVDLWVWHELPLAHPESVHVITPNDEMPQGATYTTRTMKTFDPDVNTQVRPLSMIFPLQKVQWAGMTVLVPFDSHGVAHREFSRYGGSYMKPLVFRGDCLHNIVDFRWWPW